MVRHLLTATIHASALCVSMWFISQAYLESRKEHEKEETKRITEIAKHDAEMLPHKVRQTELMVFLMTRNEYPVDKWGCPLPEMYQSVKQKNGKSKTKRIC